ncbi:Rne/Rng family ribonuclease [uncultured Nocardioides sp.]|uniref:Rne/Rng family ribonuclease n=1 Tax=uncultured Nocardioides sp. TaxID=198441 RepID=UPI00262EA345|nr:Rne/Rng family ribonuclease [uncultured Nocardioides sp.]
MPHDNPDETTETTAPDGGGTPPEQAPDDVAAAGPAPAAAPPRKRTRKSTRKAAPAEPAEVAGTTDADPATDTPADEPAAPRRTAKKAAKKAPAKKAAARKTTAGAAKRTSRKTAAAPETPDTTGTPDAVVEDALIDLAAVEGTTAPQTPAEAPAEGPAVTADATDAATDGTEPSAEAPAEPQKRARRSRKKAAAAPLFQAPAPVTEPVAEPVVDDAEPAEPTEPTEATEAPEPAAEKPAKAKKKKSGGKKKRAEQAEAPAEDDADATADVVPADAAADAADDTAADAADDSTDDTTDGAATGEAPEDGADDDSDDESGEGGGGGRRRRRRRGGRRRRKGGGDGPDGDSGDTDGAQGADDAPGDGNDQKATAADATADGEEKTSRDDAGGGNTRRRRRRRAGEAGDTDDSADASTVTRVRRARSVEDEITAVAGSTRLEAKKQRRREGREAGRRRAPIVSEAEFLARRESVDRSMVVRQRDDLTQIAVLEDGVLVEHYVARESQTSLIGNVYLGRVQNVLPSMEAAFVDIGKGRNAVLYAGEVNWAALGHKDGQPRKIESVLSSGQSVLVQVTKDPVGHKGARLTSQVSLAGRFLVYVPDGTTSGISRKLPDVERSRLKSLLKEIVPEGASVIVRTAAEGATEEQLTHDVERLTSRWAEIESKAKGGAPAMLYGEPDLTLKVVRDLFTEDFAELVVDGDAAWETVHSYVSQVAPDLEDRVVRHRTGENGKDSFALKRIDEQIAKGLDRKVWLPSGGSLIIDRTEAMTVVDVNTGKFTGSGGNLEETVTKNNLEAAEEMVRQLRLRDIGGIIVIDFIDMVLENNRDLVLRRLVECLGRDRTRHQVAEVTSLGLVQLTRKRIGTGLLEAFSESCDHCGGRGLTVHDMPVATSGSGGDPDEGEGRRGGRRRGGRNRNGENGNGNGHGHTEPAPPRPAPSPSYVAAVAKPENADRAPLDLQPDEQQPDEQQSDEQQSDEQPPVSQDPVDVTVDEPVEDVAEAALVSSAEEPEQPVAEETAPEPEPEPAPEPEPEPVDTAPRTVTRTTRRRAVRPAGSPEGATAAVVVAAPASAAPTPVADAPPPPKVVTTTRARRARRTTPTELGDRGDHGGA